jgi:hypothetical protein
MARIEQRLPVELRLNCYESISSVKLCSRILEILYAQLSSLRSEWLARFDASTVFVGSGGVLEVARAHAVIHFL